MNPLPALYRSGMKLIGYFNGPLSYAAIYFLVFFLSTAGWGVNAQTVSWSDSFEAGVAPTENQCTNWSTFLADLDGKDFSAVTLSGTFDMEGKTITDPVAANQLAALLHSRTAGKVVSGPDTWIVSLCGAGRCDGPSIALSVISSVTGGEGCDCAETYAVRPQATNTNWGGVNTATCFGPSQTMSVVFHSGVTITANGPTTFCEGGSVELTASTEICSPPYAYAWSNGETDPSITVTEPGSYSVTVTGADGCSGISAPLEVDVSAISVDAGADVTICEEGVQLNAVGSSGNDSGPTVNEVCIFDAKGGNCTFTENLCNDGYDQIVDQTFSKDVTIANPESINFHLYYSPSSKNTIFLFKLNGEQIGSYLETRATSTCTPVSSGQYPRSFAFSASDFKQYWNEASANTLTVEVDSDAGGVYMAGIAAEVVTPSAFYSWTPADGLSDATVSNPIAQPEVSTVYTVTFTDASGCTATDQVEVKVKCQTAPVAICQEVTKTLSEQSCEADVQAVDFDGGSTSDAGGELTFAVAPAGPYPVGITEVVLTVTDANGESSTCTTSVTVTDAQAPSIVTPEDLVVANDPGECFATLALDEPEASDNCGVESISKDHEGDAFPVGETIVTWTVTDSHGNQNTATQKVNVVNTDPVINSVEASASSVTVNTSITLVIAFTDNNVSTATIDWADGSSTEIVNDPENIFEVSHIYAKSGSYSVTITVEDACGASDYAYESIVVINNRSGSVSGGGWFDSPRGAYSGDPRSTGKATFAFDVSNENRDHAPEGHIVFNFKGARIKFRSTHFEWLNVEDKTAAMKAFGRLNGTKDYQILISVADDDNDTGSKVKSGKDKKGKDQIRVKIWDPQGVVIYDTQAKSPDDAIAQTPLGGGSIKVAPEGSSFKKEFESPVASSYGGESSSAYPNPFEDWVDVQFNSSSPENVIIQVLDLSGKVIFNEVFPVSEDGTYPLDIQEDSGEPGIYILVIKQGKRVEFLRIVRN